VFNYRTLGIVLILGAVAFAANITLTSFNSGEVSPYMKYRSDFAKYDSSLQTLQNMIVLPQGPVTRRPGTKYIATTHTDYHHLNCRLIPFKYSSDDAYVLEFGSSYMRVFRNGGRVMDPNDGNEPYQISTPFASASIYDIKFVQSADVMYFVDGDYHPQKLTRTDHDSWAFESLYFDGTGPFISENTTDVTLSFTGTTGDVNVTASTSDLFEINDTWSVWSASHASGPNTLTGDLTSDANSAEIIVQGSYYFSTHGTWTGQVTLEQSIDGGDTWVAALPTVYSKGDNNVSEYGIEDDIGVLYRVKMTNYGSGTCTYSLARSSDRATGAFYISGWEDANTVEATILSDLSSTSATTLWSRPYWSLGTSFPRAIALHEQRLFLGASDAYPNTIWASATDDFENMRAGTSDDTAFTFLLSGNNSIQWMISDEHLFLGTLGGAGRLAAAGTDEAITPTNIEYKHQGKHGSSSVQAVSAGDAILYLERGGVNVREFTYSFERDKYVSPDLTVLAEHITSPGIIDMSYQSNPHPILWCVRSDGVMVSLTYSRENDIVAWAKHVTDGEFESVCVIPGDDEDEVWVTVARTIDGNDVRYVEQFQDMDWGTASSTGVVANADSNSYAISDVNNKSTNGVYAIGNDFIEPNEQKNPLAQITGVQGTTELNGNVYSLLVEVADRNQVYLLNPDTAEYIDTTNFGTYTGGGTIREVNVTPAGLSQADCFFVDSGLSYNGGTSFPIDYVRRTSAGWLVVPNNDFNDGDLVVIYGARNMTEINGQSYAVKPAADANHLYLRNTANTEFVDTSGWNAYLGGGRVYHAAITFSNLDHLEGKTVSVLADGNALSDEVVSGGSVTIDKCAHDVHIGLPYTSVVETMPLVYNTKEGSTMSSTTRIAEVRTNFYETLGCEAGTTASTESVFFYKPTEYTDSVAPLYTGWTTLPMLQGYWNDPSLYFKQEKPYPMTIRAIVAK